MGFICLIGLYPLFYKMNKPESRWRSNALLTVVILGYPLYLFFNYLSFYGKVISPSFMDAAVLFIALCFLSFVLLGNNRFRMFTAAAFIFSIINLAQFPVIFFTNIAIYPADLVTYMMEKDLSFPLLYYGGILFGDILITVCSLLAARWLRNTKSKPPLNLYVPFNALFIFFTLIVLFWWEDFTRVMFISLIFSSFMGTLLIVILIFLFYLYARLTADNMSAD